MNTSAVRAISVLATGIRFDAERLHVQLSDGREISAPLEWFPSLRNATEQQRRKWRLIGKGGLRLIVISYHFANKDNSEEPDQCSD